MAVAAPRRAGAVPPLNSAKAWWKPPPTTFFLTLSPTPPLKLTWEPAPPRLRANNNHFAPAAKLLDAMADEYRTLTPSRFLMCYLFCFFVRLVR